MTGQSPPWPKQRTAAVADSTGMQRVDTVRGDLDGKHFANAETPPLWGVTIVDPDTAVLGQSPEEHHGCGREVI